MFRQPGRRLKSLSPFNPQIAAVQIPNSSQAFDHKRNLWFCGDYDAQINDRFGGQSEHSRASNMFDRQREVADERPNLQSQLLKNFWPSRVIINDDDSPHKFETAVQYLLRDSVHIALPSAPFVRLWDLGY